VDGQVGDDVRVGVRPEKITLQPEEAEASPGLNSVSGLLRMSTYIGVSHQFTVEGPGGTTLTVYQQNLGSTKMPHPGESVRLTWEPEYTFAVRPASVPITSEEEERE
jgi:spermidine/putrescine transport system ATP-binding protein